MIVLDTNAVLRFLLQDNREMADFVEDQMLRNRYMIPVEVVSEAVYVLTKVYKADRMAVVRLFNVLLSDRNSQFPHRSVVEHAVRVYGETKFDFVDCLMAGYSKQKNHEILTFDKKLSKYLSKK